jgi:hypothetical protein
MSPVPLHLSHQPIFVIDDYEEKDGRYTGNTDAKGLSLGLPQWDESDGISLKIWRHTGVKWSRQSEEIPVHRALDLTLLFLLAILARKNGTNTESISCGDLNIQAKIPIVPKQDQDAERLHRMLGLLSQYLEEEKDTIRDRLTAISEVLKKLGVS